MTDDRWNEIYELLQEKNSCIEVAKASLDLENNAEPMEEISRETGISTGELLEFLQEIDEAETWYQREIGDVHPRHRIKRDYLDS